MEKRDLEKDLAWLESQPKWRREYLAHVIAEHAINEQRRLNTQCAAMREALEEAKRRNEPGYCAAGKCKTCINGTPSINYTLCDSCYSKLLQQALSRTTGQVQE